MGKNLDTVKGFIGLTVLTPIAGMAMGAVGNLGVMSAGMRGATQSLIGIGVVGHAAGMLGFKK